MSRGPRGAAVSALSLRPPLYQQAIVPSAFRLQVGWLAQEPPFKFFPAVPGIPDRLSRRTWPFLPLIRRKPGTEEELGLLYDSPTSTVPFGPTVTVYRANLLLLRTEAEFLALPKEQYASPEDAFSAGWRVD